MTQYENNTSCNIMYEIRDKLNSDNIFEAAVLARKLVSKLEYIMAKQSTSDCKLDCSTDGRQ